MVWAEVYLCRYFRQFGLLCKMLLHVLDCLGNPLEIEMLLCLHFCRFDGTKVAGGREGGYPILAF